MEFEKLLIQISDKELLEKINELLIRKRAGIELGIEPKISVINNFIESKLDHFKNAVSMFDPRKKPNHELLQEEFIKILENNEK